MSSHTTVTIIGAGQAGLAMSRHLTDRSVDHVILERGRVAERWRSERWDSLKLLTPNWMSRLPGWSYRGPDPDGFMTMPQITRYLTDFAHSFDAPVQDETAVFSARRTDVGYVLDTNHGTHTTRFLIVATGAAAVPAIPELSGALPGAVHQVTPKHYKNPDQLPGGRVLVVGASASGIQLAEEIHRSGRPVTVAVGAHTRLPRTYRGLDVQRWLDMTGTLDRRWDEVADIEAARRAPSLQLVGGRDGLDLDLTALQAIGVELVGRLEDADGLGVTFADDLAATVAAADASNHRLLGKLDRWAADNGLSAQLDAPSRPRPVDVGEPATTARLGAGGFRTVLWATGYRPDHSWVHVDGVHDATGALAHDGGVVTGAPGMYVLGMPLLRTRRSTFIDGVGADAAALCTHLARHLDHTGVLS